jgi:hypothetical protein
VQVRTTPVRRTAGQSSATFAREVVDHVVCGRAPPRARFRRRFAGSMPRRGEQGVAVHGFLGQFPEGGGVEGLVADEAARPRPARRQPSYNFVITK